MFELLPSLDKKVVSGWNADWNALASVASPDMQSWVARSTVDSEEVEVRVKACKDGILLTILHKVRCCWGKQVGAMVSRVRGKRKRVKCVQIVPISSCLSEGPRRKAQTYGGHLCKIGDTTNTISDIYYPASNISLTLFSLHYPIVP